MWIEGEQAWKNVLTNDHSRWDKVASRFGDEFMSVVTPPKFKIDPTARFFCIGSCFARNIDTPLADRFAWSGGVVNFAASGETSWHTFAVAMQMLARRLDLQQHAIRFAPLRAERSSVRIFTVGRVNP